MKGIAILLLLLNISIHAQEKPTLCWMIKGNGLKQPSLLFGTMHSANPKLIEQSLFIRVFFPVITAVAIERLDDTAYTKHWNIDDYLCPQHLRDLLSPEDYDLVWHVFFEDARFDLNQLGSYYPIVLMEQFEVSAKPVKLADTSYPMLRGGRMESAFINLATSKHLPLYGLESYREQDSMNYKVTPIAEQAKCLLNFIKKYKAGINPHDLRKCYNDEDLNCLCNIAKFNTNEYYDSVIRVGRNLNWMKKIPSMLEKQSMLIAVGAEHLCGEDGLVALLRKQGYILKPVPVWHAE
jgi:uncharacterized protein YbaP (TraB family)